MVTSTGLSPLLGRAAELARLQAALAAVLAGTGKTTLVVGEAGIGKTRLVEELAAEARAQGTPVLWGRCLEDEGAPAYWPWMQIIRAAARAYDPHTVRTALGGATGLPAGAEHGAAPLAGQALNLSSVAVNSVAGQAIAQLVPDVRALLPETAPQWAPEQQPNRFRSFEAVCSFLRTLAGAAPLVVIIDDMQWADGDSLLLQRFATRELGDAPILLLATCRNDEAQQSQVFARVLAEVSRQPGCERITLHGLAEPDVGRVIATMTGTAPPASLVANVYQRTEGNPLFVTEIVRSLPPEAWVSQPGGGGIPAIPPSVLDVVRGRLERLSATCRRVLTVAAVMGREFSLGALECIQDERGVWPAGDELLDMLEEAERARIIDGMASTPGRFSFVHELMREALYASVPAGRRVRLHRRVGAALDAWYGEDATTHLEELAHHFFQAAPGGDVEQAIAYAEQAAQRAVEQLAYEAGAEFYDMALRALDLLPAAPAGAVGQDPDGAARTVQQRRYELLMLRGGAEVRAGRLDAAQETFLGAAAIVRRDHARHGSAETAERLARAALGLQLTALTYGVVDTARVRLLEEALAALDSVPQAGQTQALRARLLARLAMELSYSGERERGESLSQEAVRLARAAPSTSSGQAPSTSHVLSNAEGSGQASATLAFTLQARRWVAWGPDTIAERLALGAEMVELAQTLGDRELLMAGYHTRFVALQELGEMRTVAREADYQARLADELRSPYYQWHVMVYRAMRAVLDGSFDEGEQLARRALALGQRAEAPNAEQVFTLQCALLRRHQGRLAEEEAAIRQEIARYPELPVWRCLLALLACELEREDEARQLVEQLAHNQFADLPRDVFWLCNMALLSEVCARLGEAEHATTLHQLLAPYATLNVMAGRVACLGAVAHYLGRLAATRGAWDAAARSFEDALAAHERMGAPVLLARTRYAYAAMLVRRMSGADERLTAEGRARCARQARELLDAAHATATELGMAALTRRIAQLRDDPAGWAPPPAFPAGLTAREVAVLRLLARGSSNPEIGAELGISVKTVERHTVNIYDKIDARNRVDAAAYALRHGLV